MKRVGRDEIMLTCKFRSALGNVLSVGKDDFRSHV